MQKHNFASLLPLCYFCNGQFKFNKRLNRREHQRSFYLSTEGVIALRLCCIAHQCWFFIPCGFPVFLSCGCCCWPRPGPVIPLPRLPNTPTTRMKTAKEGERDLCSLSGSFSLRYFLCFNSKCLTKAVMLLRLCKKMKLTCSYSSHNSRKQPSNSLC